MTNYNENWLRRETPESGLPIVVLANDMKGLAGAMALRKKGIACDTIGGKDIKRFLEKSNKRGAKYCVRANDNGGYEVKNMATGEQESYANAETLVQNFDLNDFRCD